MTIEQDYWKGFMDKCAEHGVDPTPVMAEEASKIAHEMDVFAALLVKCASEIKLTDDDNLMADNIEETVNMFLEQKKAGNLKGEEAEKVATDIAGAYLAKHANELSAELAAGSALLRNKYGFEKEAQLPNTSDLISGVFGDGLMGTAADIGSYFIPGVGTARFGIDALSDFGNVFQKGLNWKQRLGNLGSGLANTGFAALGLLPGGGWLAKGLGTAGKWLGKLFGMGGKAAKIGKGLRNVAAGAQRLGRTMRAAPGMGGKISRWALGNPYKNMAGWGGRAARLGHGVATYAPLIGMQMGSDMLRGGAGEIPAGGAAGFMQSQLAQGGGAGPNYFAGLGSTGLTPRGLSPSANPLNKYW